MAAKTKAADRGPFTWRKDRTPTGPRTNPHRELEALFDGARHPVVAAHNGRITYANPAVKAFTLPGGLRGMLLADLVSAPDRVAPVLTLGGQSFPVTRMQLEVGGAELEILRGHQTVQRPLDPPVPSGPGTPEDRPLWDLLEDVRLGYWLGDPHGVTLVTNQQALRLLNCTRQDLYSATLQDRLDIRMDTPFQGTCHMVRRNPEGGQLNLELVFALLKATDGTVMGSQAIIRDVTAQSQVMHELLLREAWLTTVVNLQPAAALVLDPQDLAVEYASTQAATLLGTATPLAGVCLEALPGLHNALHVAHQVLHGLTQHPTTGPIAVALEGRGGVATAGWLMATRVNTVGGARVCVVIQHAPFGAHVATALLHGALATSSQALCLAAEGVAAAAGPPDAPARQQWEQDAARLQTALEDAATLLAAHAAPGNLQPLLLGPVLHTVAERHLPAIEAAGARLHGLGGPWPKVRAQAARVALALDAVLLNAHQHGCRPEGGGQVRLNLQDGGNGWVGVCVEDDGPGLPAHVFTRAVSGAGTGAGLATAAAALAACGGRIWVEAPEGGGARLCLVWPAAAL